MSYRIYQTRGFILSGVNIGEANRLLDLFTEELGMVRALAQGVRKLNSKLRFGLQEHSFSKISLVRGREFWRVVGVEKMNDFDFLKDNREALQVTARVFSLLKRLLSGEQKEFLVFEELVSALKLMQDSVVSGNLLLTIEVILVFRILQKLGYVGDDSRFSYLANSFSWRRDSIKLDESIRTLVVKQINNSLAHSHL